MKIGNRLVFTGFFVLVFSLFTACPEPPGFVSVSGIDFDEKTLTLLVGETHNLIAKIKPKKANIKHIDWDSEDADIVSVDTKGKLTACNPGETIITATTMDGGYVAECTVIVVRPILVTGITLNPTALMLTIPLDLDETISYPLIATVHPENASQKKINWTSSNPDVVTVDDEGIVTALKAGRATITVTTVDGNKSAECIVTVTIKPDIAMLPIPAGSFLMGSPPAEESRFPHEGPQHRMELSGFYMSKFQITQSEYMAVIGKTLDEQQLLAIPTKPGDYGKGDKYPMYFVSWYDALAFCNKMSVLDSFTPVYIIGGSTDPDEWGKIPELLEGNTDAKWSAIKIDPNSNGYRLPTEAQWEYACRAETTTAYYTGDTINNSIRTGTGWYTANSQRIAHKVGELPANNWGLYDMHGNVWEWCWNRYGSYPCTEEPSPQGADSGSAHVARGGAWNSSSAEELRSAYRISHPPATRKEDVGFRIVRPVE